VCTAIIVNMSEEAAHQPTNPPELPERPDPELTEDVFTRPDPVLQQLADRSHQVGMTVTLYLPWGAASGLIIGGAKYFAWVASNVRGHAANEEGDRAKMLGVYASLFDGWTDVYTPAEADSRDVSEVLKRGYIHLKDVTCSVPGSVSPVHHDYLRIQLSQVTAWTQLT